METVITIIILIAFVLYFIAQDSHKDTKRERYGEAVGKLANMTADSIAGFANKITEPTDKKAIRLAKEALAERNGRLYRFSSYSQKDYLQHLFTIDEHFKKSLDILNLAEDKWKSIAWDLFYIGVLRKESRDFFDKSKRNDEIIRRHMLTDWSNNSISKERSKCIKDAFKHFGIKSEEWIKYGDAVVEMYNLYEKPDIREFGFISAIMPMKDNSHLL